MPGPGRDGYALLSAMPRVDQARMLSRQFLSTARDAGVPPG